MQFHRVDAVYRKHFFLPEAWHGDRVSLRFEGVYKSASVWINGAPIKFYGGSAGAGGWSAEAYTEFEVRLDNVTGVTYGNRKTAKPNLIAIYVNGEPGNEHWYTGAGLYRSVCEKAALISSFAIFLVMFVPSLSSQVIIVRMNTQNTRVAFTGPPDSHQVDPHRPALAVLPRGGRKPHH